MKRFRDARFRHLPRLVFTYIPYSALLVLIVAFAMPTQAQPSHASPLSVGPAPDLVLALPTNGNTGNFGALVDGSGALWFVYRDTATATAVLYRRDPNGSTKAIITEQGQALAYGTPELSYLPDGRAIFTTTNRDTRTGGANTGSIWFIDERFGWVRPSFLSRGAALPLVQR